MRPPLRPSRQASSRPRTRARSAGNSPRALVPIRGPPKTRTATVTNQAEGFRRACRKDTERLHFHQEQSQPTLQELHVWLTRQLDEKLTEPNSALGGAIRYMLRHWEELTLFLRQAGAPLDNNVCERALKKAILHRKNALFYKTCHGAHVGDVFMSLIYTCQLCGANAFDYLTELDRHAEELSANPQGWMPWNYRQTLDGTSVSRP